MADASDGQYGDPYAERRDQMEQAFAQLPSAASDAYWSALDGEPLEVLCRCVRERLASGNRADAERVFEVMMRLLDGRVKEWARRIAASVPSAQHSTVDQDLQEECYWALWQVLSKPEPTFFVEHFQTALVSMESKIAHRLMEQQGYWRRPGVVMPTRVPVGKTDSIDATRPDGEGEHVASLYLPDTRAEDMYDQIDTASDVRATLAALTPDQRALVADMYWRGLSQTEIAEPLGLTPDAVRHRLKVVYQRLRELLADPGAAGGY